MIVVSVDEEVVVVRLEARAADLERPHEAAQRVAGLVKRNLVPALHQPVRRRHSGNAAADDADLHFGTVPSTAGCARTTRPAAAGSSAAVAFAGAGSGSAFVPPLSMSPKPRSIDHIR